MMMTMRKLLSIASLYLLTCSTASAGEPHGDAYIFWIDKNLIVYFASTKNLKVNNDRVYIRTFSRQRGGNGTIWDNVFDCNEPTNRVASVVLGTTDSNGNAHWRSDEEMNSVELRFRDIDEL